MLSWAQAGVLALTSESSKEREGESVFVCARVRVCKRTAFCQHMFDRCQKERAGLIAVMQGHVEGARWEQ